MYRRCNRRAGWGRPCWRRPRGHPALGRL